MDIGQAGPCRKARGKNGEPAVVVIPGETGVRQPPVDGRWPTDGDCSMRNNLLRMGRVWRGLVEAACFVGFAVADFYAVLCLLAANGGFGWLRGLPGLNPVAFRAAFQG